jgi:hypothetical protein
VVVTCIERRNQGHAPQAPPDPAWATAPNKDNPDYVVYSGEWEIGRIYERKGFPDDVGSSGRCMALF